MTTGLAGKRVLVVDDESMIAMLLETALEDEDCVVLGPFGRVGAALDTARHGPVDFALLDINVAGEKIYPVAEQLEQRGIPFLILSGYGEHALAEERKHWNVCAKPFVLADVIARMRRMLET